MTKVRTAVIPVAGLGTRFLPATKALPKEILPLLDRPCIDYIVSEAADAGIEKIIFVTYKKHVTTNQRSSTDLCKRFKKAVSKQDKTM